MTRTGVRASAIIIRNNKILLIHRFKNGEEYWVSPGGGVEDNESLEEALVREVKEETNLKVMKFEKAFEAQSFKDGKMQPFFICDTDDGEVEIIGEEKEVNSKDNSYELVWVDLGEIKDIRLLPKDAAKKLAVFIK